MGARDERTWQVGAADLLLGAACAGCRRPALHVCPTCSRALRPRVERVPGPGPPVVAAGRYDGAWRAVLPAWKERGQTGVEPWLALALAAAVLEVADGGAPIVLVPVPTSRRNRRRRSRDHMVDLARSTAALLATSGLSTSVAPILTMARQTTDQAELTADERSANVRHAFRCRSRRGPSGSVVVVDDVTTTGATLREALRALAAGGRVPAGAATVVWRP